MLSNNYQPTNVLVTGGAGFIGSHFIRYLLMNNPHVKVTNVDSLTYAGNLANLLSLPDPKRYSFVKADICNGELMSALLQEKNIDTIVHFAAESHVDRSILSPSAFVTTNILGTFTLLEAACQFWLSDSYIPKGCRFHHVSTDEVYGSLSADAVAFTEKTAYAPRSPYSASKAAADHLVNAYYHTYGLPVTISNCSNNYGPYQHTEKLIPTIIRACLDGAPIPLYGNGSNIRDWLYVEDHCAGIYTILAAGRVGETYNIGGNNQLSNVMIAETICSLMDIYKPRNKPHRELITFVADRPGHDWRYAIDFKKIFDELGWVPRETFESGLLKTLTFYCDQLCSL